jgi:antitoxin (DNA-binding transcriptional repressor) of toxin-antitoxin stability system
LLQPGRHRATAVTQSGYLRQNDGTYLKQSLPPGEFQCNKAAIQEAVQEIDAESLENLNHNRWPVLGKHLILLTEGGSVVHIVHMKEISIRDLHLKTGKWIRNISLEQKIVITERGEPVATLIPFESAHKAIPFCRRELDQRFTNLPPIEHDSTQYISTDRDRA